MTMLINQLTKDVMGLTKTDRALLAHRLIKSLDNEQDDDIEITFRQKFSPQGILETLKLQEPPIDKLEVYRGLEVPEVWFLKNNQFFVYHLQKDTYKLATGSRFLP